jgi:hypothetical protein
MTLPSTLEVLQRRESHRDSTFRPWNFLEAVFPLDARVTSVDVLYNSAVSPLTKLGNSTTREEHADSNWKKVTVQEWKKGFANSTNMDIM